MATIRLYDPTAPRREARDMPATAFPALAGLSGAVVGFIDNAKPNFNALADELAVLLQHKYGVREVLRHRKPSASVPARDDVLERFAQQCDVVIAGSGD